MEGNVYRYSMGGKFHVLLLTIFGGRTWSVLEDLHFSETETIN